MPIELNEKQSGNKGESRSAAARSTDEKGRLRDHGSELAHADLPSKAVPPRVYPHTRRRRLLLGGSGIVILAAALWFGIPWIRLTLNTVSTDDAFVNGHVTFVAARVRGQVSR